MLSDKLQIHEGKQNTDNFFVKNQVEKKIKASSG